MARPNDYFTIAQILHEKLISVLSDEEYKKFINNLHKKHKDIAWMVAKSNG